MRKRINIAVAMALAAAWGVATAHHSPAVFDRGREVTIEGVVTEFRWGNPHCWIHLDVADANGEVGDWSVEMNPASTLVRSGWTSRTLKVGDKVAVRIHPLRTDEKGGQYVSVTLPDGTAMDASTREREVVRLPAPAAESSATP